MMREAKPPPDEDLMHSSGAPNTGEKLLTIEIFYCLHNPLPRYLQCTAMNQSQFLQLIVINKYRQEPIRM